VQQETPAEEAEEPQVEEIVQVMYDETVRVTKVVDGDTLDISPAVDGMDRVRLIGVDTPETNEPGCEVQPYGPDASRFTTSELLGEEVGLEFDEDRDDRDDRLLAYVHKDSELFNETLLEEGYAQVYIVSPNDEYEERFEEAQEEAQTARLGIWELSTSEQAQLTDRGNGLGGDGCEQQASPPQENEPLPQVEEPEPLPEPDRPSEAPETPALPNGVDCDTVPPNTPVAPGSKGDRDGDGIACET